MAASQKSVLRCTLEDSIASIASVFPQLTVEAARQSGVVREQLDSLRDELRWILGVVSGLHRLVQYYEDDGQQIRSTHGRYCVLEWLDGFLATTRENLKDLTVISLQSTLRLLEPYLAIVALVCDDANTLSGIHHRLASDVGLQSAVEKVPPHGPEAHHFKGSCAQPSGRGLEELLTTEPSCDDDTIIRWMQELNSSSHDRPPLELFPELCLVRARNRQRPLYRVAASEWYRYANTRWSVVKCEAEKLFSDSRRNNFIQWVLEFARAKYPDPFECAGRPGRAARIIDLTNELEQGQLTPLHVSSMLGLSELCKSLLSGGPGINSTGSFDSHLYCALCGPQMVVKLKQPSSWPTILAAMEPANNETIHALVSAGAGVGPNSPLLLESPHASKWASLAFVASVKTGNHEIFQSIMDKGGSFDGVFRTMLLSLFPDELPSDSRELMTRLYAIALGYNIGLARDEFPWEGRQDEVGSAIWDLMDQHHLSLPKDTIMPIPTTSDETYDEAVRNCVLIGDEMYLERLALDARFNANLAFLQDGTENGTILHMVVSGQHYNMLPILASRAADFYAVDAQGRTPLMVVEDVKMLRLLVKRYGVSTESTDVNGRNIWHYAAANNDKDMMEWLFENDPLRRSNINAVTKQGYSPLMESLLYINTLVNERQHLYPPRPLVAYMLLQQEDLDFTRGGSADSDLLIGHIAVQWGKLDLVNILIEKGVNFVALDGQGRSPLHHLNSSAELGLVQRLMELCGRLPVLSTAGVTPMESLYANSFSIEPGGRLSNHPACFKPITEAMLQHLLTRNALDAHNDAGQGCWAVFCSTALQCFQRCSQMEGGIPAIVEHSFRNGMLCLYHHYCLEAHESETGQPAVLSLASFHDDGTAYWSLQFNPLVDETVQLCLLSDMKQFLYTQHVFGLMKEALELGRHLIIQALAKEMALHKPSSQLGGLSVLEYAMGLESERLLSFHNLFSYVTADQLSTIGPQLCRILFKPGTGICRREKLSILLDQGLSPDTRIIQTEAPEKDTTILCEALAQDWPDIVTLLLARGADPGLGRTHKAITTALLRNNNSLDTLSRLISQLDPSFDWNFTVSLDGTPGFNAIDLAIQARAHAALDMLFSRTNINSIVHSRSDINRGTPAHLAAWRNDPQSIRILHQHGADLSRTDDQGRTILHIAAEISSPELVELAAQFCALGATDAAGRTAGDISVSKIMRDADAA
ncbi:hypothetical protein E4U55_005042 [Claviceps digitariae]|nr:hypothetical protein E4U55_005042 [Claviceps digitariae]